MASSSSLMASRAASRASCAAAQRSANRPVMPARMPRTPTTGSSRSGAGGGDEPDRVDHERREQARRGDHDDEPTRGDHQLRNRSRAGLCTGSGLASLLSSISCRPNRYGLRRTAQLVSADRLHRQAERTQLGVQRLGRVLAADVEPDRVAPLERDHRPVGQRHLGVVVGVMVDRLDHHAAVVDGLAGDLQMVHVDRQIRVLVQRAGHELAERLAAQVLGRDPLRHVVGQLGGRRHLEHQQVLRAEQAGQPLDQLDIVLEVGGGVAEQAPQDRLVADQPVAQSLQLVEVLLVGEVELHRQGLAAEGLDEGQVADGLQADPQHLRAHVDRDVQHLRGTTAAGSAAPSGPSPRCPDRG